MSSSKISTVLILSTFFSTVYSADITILYTTPEEQQPPLYLGNVAEDSNLSTLATLEEYANMRYTFLTHGNNYISSFLINENTGALSTNDKLDREAICPFQKLCVLQLRIGANSGTFFQPINVNVTVTDINDNKPEFDQTSIVLNIPEDTGVNTTYPVIGAVDKDMGDKNSLQTYELLPDSGTFGLMFDHSLSGNIQVSVVLKQKLDREMLDHYQIYLVAKDGGNPQRSSMLTINVTVMDINDNKPVFNRQQYDTTVPENIAVSSKILNVTAVDRDAGDNKEIEYTLISSPSNSQTFFAIDKTTGEISVTQKLTHTQGTPMKLIVQASDKGSPPKSSQVAVMITVTDVNDNAPEINVNLLSGTSTARAEENSPNGTVVAYIGVVDEDTGNNGLVSCRLTDDTFRLSKLAGSETEYKVLVNKPLDRETKIEHVVTVECQDAGTPFLKTSSSFIVQVIDKNDNFPEFLKTFYNESMVESEQTGVYITKVTASDLDEGENAQVKYFIEQANADKFYVDPNTGVIKTIVPFDREHKDLYRFEVLAVDGGQSKTFTSTATVELHILDENDETPLFTQSVFRFEVQENLPTQTIVGTLFASDNDIGDNGKIKFTLPLEYHSVPFVVLPSGKIQTNDILNREFKSSYDFTVVASDYGAPSRNSTAHVQIIVLDVNDNAPQIIFPTQSNSSIRVSHLTPPNSVIAKAKAFDPDNGRNGTVTYSIKSRNDDNLFIMEKSNGNLYLTRSIQTNDIKDYLLLVEVSDNGTIPRTNSTEMRIKIELTRSSASTEASIGQNVLIVITIVCVTIVLSLAIIVVIFLIRRVDNNRLLKEYPPAGKEEFQISETVQLNSNKKSILTKETSTPNGYNNNTLSSGDRKEIHESSTDPETLEGEHHRMTSLRLHHKLLNSYNKPLLYHSDDNRHLWSKKHGEDARSDLSEDITSDSGRGGSEEDVHHHQMYPRSGIVI